MIVFYRPLFVLSILPLLPCQDCGDTIKPPIYTISSPKYPKNYPNRLNCDWKISVEEPFRIQLWFTDFQFEKDEDFSCPDFLQMSDGGDSEADQVFLSCAESLADFKAENNGTASFSSSGNMLYLLMITNLIDRRKGFSATYILIPESATTTETVDRRTSPDARSTHLKSTTAEGTSTPQELIVSTTTAFTLFGTWSTANSTSKNPVTAVSTDLSTNASLTITPTESSSNPPDNLLLVVVPTVSLVLLMVFLCVTGLFMHTRRSSGKFNSSSNDSSCQVVETNPVRTGEEQCEQCSKTIYYTNESFHASPHDTYPSPYQSIKGVDGFRTAQMNARILPSEEVIGNVAYESFDGEEKRNGDYTADAGHVVNIAYESYDGEEIVDNGDTANVGEATNIAYESYDTEEIAHNGCHMPNTVNNRNIAYEVFTKLYLDHTYT